MLHDHPTSLIASHISHAIPKHFYTPIKEKLPIALSNSRQSDCRITYRKTKSQANLSPINTPHICFPIKTIHRVPMKPKTSKQAPLLCSFGQFPYTRVNYTPTYFANAHFIQFVQITFDVDSGPRAAYFRQAKNGLYIRMALLNLLLVGW